MALKIKVNLDKSIELEGTPEEIDAYISLNDKKETVEQKKIVRKVILG